MKKILFLILLLISAAYTKACYNFYFSVDKEGHMHAADDVLIPFNKNFNKQRIVKHLQKLETLLKKEPSYMALSDYAVNLAKIGRQKEALEILTALYRHYPNEYKIASNLGTTYELNGKPDSALKYIQRGIVLNKNAHEGSEWVHVRILEAKLGLLKDPRYLVKRRALRLTQEQKKDSMVRKQINIQVRERFPFSPGPDLLMACILVDLGDCYAETYSVVYAKTLYTIARQYYGDTCKVIEKKILEMQKLGARYASVVPPKPKEIMYTHIKLTGLPYKECLKENDPGLYKVKASEINTDVTALLAFAGIK